VAIDRVVFRNWKVETAQADAQDDDDRWLSAEERLGLFELPLEPPDPRAQARSERVIRAVRRAIALLDEDERELIIRYHFQGFGLPELAELTGRPLYKLASLQKRALRRLKGLLRPLVAREFGIGRSTARLCPVCLSPQRERIDMLIAARDHRATWIPVMRAIAEQCGLPIRNPQILIGHEKYHGELS